MIRKFAFLSLLIVAIALAAPPPAPAAQVTSSCVPDLAQFRADSARFAGYVRDDARKQAELRHTAAVVYACKARDSVQAESMTFTRFLARLDSALSRTAPAPDPTPTPPPVPPDSTPTTTPPPPPPIGGGAAAYTNRPSGYSNIVTDESFSDALAAGHEVRFGDGWRSTWNNDGLLRRATDATAPVSPSSVYESFYSRAGTIGGNGVGDMYHPLPNARQVFIGLTVKYDANFEWNNTSTKLLILWAGTSAFHLQARYNNRALTPYRSSQQITTWTGSIPLGQWNRIELLADGLNNRVKVWLNGELIQDAAMTFSSTAFTSLTLDSTWGGGGTKTRDSWRWVDHIVVATP